MAALTTGGGLLNSGGKVTLTSVVVANNAAVGLAGTHGVPGVSGTGLLGVGGNGGNGGPGVSGGVFDAGGARLTVSGTIFSSDRAILRMSRIEDSSFLIHFRVRFEGVAQ